MILLAAQFGTEKFVVHEKDVKECEACQREGSQGSTTKSMHTMVRLVVISLLLILLGTLDPLVQGFAAAPRGSSRPAVDDSPVDPNAKHRTHRLQHPGKHKEGAWFLGEEQHKKKKNEEEVVVASFNVHPGGRQWTFGRVPRW